MSIGRRFVEEFGGEPDGIWTAPGRVNLIGEHTDYNDGFMLPLAIPLGVTVAARRTTSGRLRAISVGRRGGFDGPIGELRPGSPKGWPAYVAGVAWSLRSAGYPVDGLDLVLDGNVPSGAGLSSSAAVECAVAIAACELYGHDVPRPELARIAQRAENDFVGMPCGILDQSASLLCTKDHVLFLDARTLDTEDVPFDLPRESLALLVIDTKAPHRHVDGEYASRRAACEHAAELLGVPALRDVDDLPTALAALKDPVLARRVRHVVTENERVLETVRRLRSGGSARDIGDLMTASHVSLRDDYEVTVPELDTAVDAALAAGAFGARMTGGGFGGCVIALVPDTSTSTVADAVAEAFAGNEFQAPESFVVTPAAGARRLG